MRRLVASSWRGQGRQVRALAGWSMVEALPFLVSGLLVARAVDEGFLEGRPETGLAWLGVLGLCVVAGAVGTRRTMERLADVVEPFRDALVVACVTGGLNRAVALGAPAQTAGLARLSHHVELAREAYASVLLVLQGLAVATAGALVGLAGLAPIALVLVAPPLLVAVVAFVVVVSRMAACQRSSIIADERIAESTVIVAAGRRDVSACGGEDVAAAIVADPIDDHARATVALARLAALRSVAVAVGGWLPVVLLLVAGPWLLERGVTTGALLGVLTYVLTGLQPALQTAARDVGGSGLWLVVTLGRLVEATEEPGAAPAPRRAPHRRHGPRLDPGPRSAPGPAPSHGGDGELRGYDVRLDRVTFGYGSRAAPVLRDLSLVVDEGAHLAVLGPSGGGKSTLAGVLAGLLRPQAGSATMGGAQLGSLDTRTLARHRVLIPQEAYVFAGTVRENLAYLRPDASRSDLDGAVEVLGAGPLVARLGGYEAELGPHRLSEGERQLVTLVRAYVCAAPLVILDEATCHLDPAAEARVEAAFGQRHGSLVVIAHRISSAMRAPSILLLDGAEAVAGTHEALLARSTLYRDLVGRWP